jgi:hypothetical protein
MPTTEPLTPRDLEGILQGLIADAQTYLEGELSPARAEATKYYRGEKFGNEEAGRSQFISTDLRDTVLAMLPSLVRIFLPTSGHVIEYQARPKTLEAVDQAVAQADQATEFVNEVVLDQDNSAFAELYACFKDALIRKLGTIKYWWEDASTYKDYTANNLDVLQYETLVADPDVEITSQKERKDPTGVPRYDVAYRHWRREGYARLTCMPPEELLISRDARSRDDATFLAHRTEKTRAELLAMGVPAEEIDRYGGPSTEIAQSIEETARRGGISHVDKAMSLGEVKNLWIEAWPIINGQLLQVRCLGPGFHVVGDPEPIDERPVAIFCPDPEPHVLVGQSIADRVMDLQLMKSSVFRAGADGLADAIFPRRYFMEGVVDRQAMESTAMGQDVAIRDGVQPQQAVWVEQHESKVSEALTFLGYLDAVKQQRIGPLPATLDPDALQSTPEIGVKATVQAASEQLELLARVFAATGMKQLGRGLLKLLVDHQPRERIVRLRNQYVAVDPRAWDAEMDVSVNVAVGTSEKLGVLAATAAAQKEILGALGPANPLVGFGQYRHTLALMLELQGIKDVSKFFQPLPVDWQPPPQPPQPNPELLLAQAEMEKAKTGLAKAQSEFEVEKVKAAQQMAEMNERLQSKGAELALKREEMHLVDERERDKAEADVAVRIAVANAQYGSQLTIAQIDADIQAEKATLERERMATDMVIATKKPPKEPAHAGA